MTEIIISLFGWIGAAISLYAYYSVSNNKMIGTSFRFQSLNILGATLILINSAYYGALPSVMVNFFWVVIGLTSVIQFRKMKRV
jgi:hypothetical protein